MPRYINDDKGKMASHELHHKTYHKQSSSFDFEYLPIVPSNAVTLQDKDPSFKEIIPKQGTTTQQTKNNICHLPSDHFKAFSGFTKFDIIIKSSRSYSLPAQMEHQINKRSKLCKLHYYFKSTKLVIYQRKKKSICTVTPEKEKNCLV